MTTDILAGAPARPSTLVPGYWLIDLPSLSIHVKRYRTSSPSSPASPTSHEPAPATDSSSSSGPTPRAVLARLRGDPLERAWRACNSIAINDPRPARSILAQPCAVVRPASAGRSRELWVFACEAEQLLGFESLTEIEPAPASVGLAQLITCPEHGHDLKCLSIPREKVTASEATPNSVPIMALRPCSPVYAPSVSSRESWTLLEAAVGEKLAWRFGSRISLIPGLRVSHEPPFDIRLRPTPTGQLLLTARPNPTPRCRRGIGASHPARDPLLLCPLDLPALFVAPHAATSVQDASLASAFESAFGPGWKTGRAEARVAARSRSEPTPEWAFYFVPLPASDGVANNIKLLSSGTIAQTWRTGQGILTLWPAHLAQPLAPRSDHGCGSNHAPPPLAGIGATDLMPLAAGLFDFFTSYTVTDTADDDGDDPVVDSDDLAGGGHDESSPKREAGSEIDDLFSAHSDSPMLTVTGTVTADGDGGGGERGDLFSIFSSPQITPGFELDADDDLFGDNGGFDAPTEEEVDSGDAVQTEGAIQDLIEIEQPQSRQHVTSEVEEPEINNAVTEDDFAFFDSPTADEPDGYNIELLKSLEYTESVAFADGEPTSASDVGLEPIHDSKAVVSILDDPALKLEIIPSLQVETEPSPQVANETISEANVDTAGTMVAPIIVIEPPAIPETPELSLPTPLTRSKVSKRNRDGVDIVPDEFTPLHLSSRPRISYGLPSPTSTVPSLRSDLVERLRKASSSSAYDYASAWDVEDEPSDIEEESGETTGVPPTPESTADSDEEQALTRPAPITVPVSPIDDEIEFDGGVCVASEWSSLKDDTTAAKALARAWGSSWIEPSADSAAEALPPSPKPTPKPETSDVDTTTLGVLVNSLVRNRFFREALTTSSRSDPIVRPLSGLTKSGVPLAELVESSSDGASISYALAQPSIQVGLSGNVFRLSMAGLPYWHEIGLQPLGGPKDLQAFVLCEPGEGSKRIASGFLDDLGNVYKTHQLGRHIKGDDAVAENGVVSVTLSRMADIISQLASRATAPTVIYIIAHLLSPTISSLRPLLRSTSNLCFIHVVPAPSIHVRNLVPIAFEVYDLIPREINRVFVRGKPAEASPTWMPFYSFTLAPTDEAPRPHLTMSWPQRSCDVLNRWRIVHTAYAYFPALDVLVATMIDTGAEVFEIKTFRLDKGNSARDRVAKAWDVFTAFAAVASTEWRLIICSYGIMGKDELEAWRSTVATRKDLVTILMMDPTVTENGSGQVRTRPPVPNIPPATFANPSATIIDETLAGSCVSFEQRQAVELAESEDERTTIYPESSFIVAVADSSGTSTGTVVYHVVHNRPPPGVTDTNTDRHKVLGPELYRLCCVGRRRYALDGPLPLHLASLSVAQRAIEVVSGALDAATS